MPKVGSNGNLTRSQISPGEKNDILVALAKPGATFKGVAKEFGRDESTISRLAAQFKPTDALARATLMARLSEMVDRVCEKADVDQLISILSRSNIGVLAPEVKGGSPGVNNQILVSVNPGSLAAVNEEFGRPALPPADGPDAGRAIQVGSVLLGESNLA